MIELAEAIVEALGKENIDIELVKDLIIKLAYKIDEYEK